MRRLRATRSAMDIAELGGAVGIGEVRRFGHVLAGVVREVPIMIPRVLRVRFKAA